MTRPASCSEASQSMRERWCKPRGALWWRPSAPPWSPGEGSHSAPGGVCLRAAKPAFLTSEVSIGNPERAGSSTDCWVPGWRPSLGVRGPHTVLSSAVGSFLVSPPAAATDPALRSHWGNGCSFRAQTLPRGPTAEGRTPKSHGAPACSLLLQGLQLHERRWRGTG